MSTFSMQSNNPLIMGMNVEDITCGTQEIDQGLLNLANSPVNLGMEGSLRSLIVEFLCKSTIPEYRLDLTSTSIASSPSALWLDYFIGEDNNLDRFPHLEICQEYGLARKIGISVNYGV